MKKALGLVLAAMLLIAALPCTAATLADSDGQTTQTEQRTGTIVNCKTQVNVREKASQHAKKLGVAKKGETFTVLGRSGNWVKIDFSGKDGFVYKTYIRVDGAPSDTPVEGKTGQIYNCKKQVNVREQATSLSKLLGVAKKGETFKVLATAENWVKIQYTSDTVGYVYKDYIKIGDEGAQTEPTVTPASGEQTGKIYNCKTQVNVREKATKDSTLLGVAKKGETFKVLGRSGNWVKIEFEGKEGFVYKSYIKVTAAEESIEGKTGTIANCSTQVNVRAKANKSSKLLGTAKKGETFKVLGRSGNWIKIDFNGKTGFVYKRYVKIG